MKFVCTRLKQLDASILLAINLVSIVLVAMNFHFVQYQVLYYV